MTTLRQDIEAKIAEHESQITWLKAELAKGEAFLEREAHEIAHWLATLVVHLQHKFTPVTSVTLEVPKRLPPSAFDQAAAETVGTIVVPLMPIAPALDEVASVAEAPLVADAQVELRATPLNPLAESQLA